MRPPVVPECIPNASILHQRRHFQEVSNFINSLPPSHTRRALGVPRLDVGMVDLVIADIPENQPVPTVSDPDTSWNALDHDFLGELFDFTGEIIHNNGTLLLFHPNDNGDFRESIQDHFPFFGFIIFKEWLGVKRLRLHSAKHMDKATNLFQVVLFVVPPKQSDSTFISSPDTRHFAFAIPMSSRLLALSSTWMIPL